MGQGRFGSCFRAQGPHGPVALKLVKPRKGCMDFQAVWAECRALQACSHPSIPQWLGIVNTARCERTSFSGLLLGSKPYFIVEELMPGASIAYWLQKAGHVFSREEIARIAGQLCDTIGHLQQCGIVHGDLRPANVLYDGERISLIDFGLALDAQDGTAFSIDRDGLACVVLFMLYSDPQIIIPGIDATWREELRIPQALRQCLEDLFDENHPWESPSQMKIRLLDALQEK
ncbi:MAG: protein kinase family protein [Eggerthellaceae bacterium]